MKLVYFKSELSANFKRIFNGIQISTDCVPEMIGCQKLSYYSSVGFVCFSWHSSYMRVHFASGARKCKLQNTSKNQPWYFDKPQMMIELELEKWQL